MTPDQDIERVLDRWFTEGPTQMPNRFLDNTLDRIDRAPQHRLALRSRLADMTVTARLAAVAAAIVIAVGVVFVVPSLPGPGQSPMPTGTPSGTAPPSSGTPPATSAPATPSITPWPTIEPSLAFGDAVSCGDETPTFPVVSLNLPPGAEKAADDSGKALATFLSNPAINPDPASNAGWRRVVLTTTDALFVSTQAPEARWLYVWLASAGAGQPVAGWYFHTSGECRPEVDFGPDARRAEIYLDPGQPINPADREVRLHLYELNCAGGQSPAGRILEPKLAYESDRILVAMVIRKLPGPRDCQGTDPYAYTLKLAEAIGQRKLLDAARVPPAPVVVQ